MRRSSTRIWLLRERPATRNSALATMSGWSTILVCDRSGSHSSRLVRLSTASSAAADISQLPRRRGDSISMSTGRPTGRVSLAARRGNSLPWSGCRTLNTQQKKRRMLGDAAMNNDDDMMISTRRIRSFRPTRVWLSKTARQLAAMAPMSEREMAKHLLEQHRLKQAGLVQKDGEE